MLPGEEALCHGRLNLCREEKQLILHRAAGHFREPRFLPNDRPARCGGFFGNVGGRARQTTMSKSPSSTRSSLPVRQPRAESRTSGAGPSR